MSSSTDLHRKGKSEIFKLFNQNFIKIINGKIKPKNNWVDQLTSIKKYTKIR